jgi:hypothetical protein
MTTTDLFISLLASRQKWLRAGLKETDRKYYLSLQKMGALPHVTIQEKRLKEAGYIKVSEAKVIPAEWEEKSGL